MNVTQQHYEQAARLLVEQEPTAKTHSEPYWEGYLDAVACCIAGQPGDQENNSPYPPGTLKCDAWAYGWENGQAFAEQHAQPAQRKWPFWVKN